MTACAASCAESDLRQVGAAFAARPVILAAVPYPRSGHCGVHHLASDATAKCKRPPVTAVTGDLSILSVLSRNGFRSAARQREPFPDRLIRLSHGRCPRGRPSQTTAKRRSISRLNATSHGSSVATRRRRRDARCIAYAGSRPNATPQRPARSTRNGPTMYGLLATPLSMLRRCLRPSLSAGDHSIRCHPSPHAKCFRACCSELQFGSSGREAAKSRQSRPLISDTSSRGLPVISSPPFSARGSANRPRRSPKLCGSRARKVQRPHSRR
jgi:hypothetical protein